MKSILNLNQLKIYRKYPKTIPKKIFGGLEILENGLNGNIKKVTNFSPEFRLRIANYRILFEIEENVKIIYRVLPRKDAYK